LDTALEVLTSIQENHSIPLVARHVNPLAAAYQSLGYVQKARDIVQTMLSNRTAGEEPENGVAWGDHSDSAFKRELVVGAHGVYNTRWTSISIIAMGLSSTIAYGTAEGTKFVHFLQSTEPFAYIMNLIR
jgi:hypothetical protein